MKPLLHEPSQVAKASPYFTRFVTTCAGDECWDWPGWKDPEGYGQTSWWHEVGGRQRKTTAHRLSYVLLIGPIPDGFTVDHLCRNRACVNPAHLEAVTPAENTARSNGPGARTVAAKAAVGTCGEGHADWNARGQCRTCMNTRTARNWAVIRQAMAATGLPRREYGQRFGYSLTTAERLIKEAARA